MKNQSPRILYKIMQKWNTQIMETIQIILVIVILCAVHSKLDKTSIKDQHFMSNILVPDILDLELADAGPELH